MPDAAQEKIRVPRIGPGRPRTKPDSLASDKAYSNGPCRDYLRTRGIRHTIPEKVDSRAVRLRKDSRDKRGYVFLGTVIVAAPTVWLRS